MSLLVEPPEVSRPAPDAGAINAARTRQMRRRRRYATGLTAVALAGAVVWAAVSPGSRPAPAGVRGRMLAFDRARQRRRLIPWHISPALEGGEYGWCIVEGADGGCATTPTATAGRAGGAGAVGTLAGVSITPTEERFTALIGPAVRGVLADGRPAVLVTRAELPYGLRIAQIDVARHAPKAQTLGVPALEGGLPKLLATGAAGRALGAFQTETAASPRLEVRWWAKPRALPTGPCQIRAQGLPSLQPQWGHVVAAIHPYPGRIIGRAFRSCIDTEYYLHNWPLETAVLLDAQHPGSRPAAIPGMSPLPGHRGLFSAPGDWQGEITATRHGNSWLVVAGGSGVAQRVTVLRHLQSTVSL